jgi:hypothetical protein
MSEMIFDICQLVGVRFSMITKVTTKVATNISMLLNLE